MNDDNKVANSIGRGRGHRNYGYGAYDYNYAQRGRYRYDRCQPGKGGPRQRGRVRPGSSERRMMRPGYQQRFIARKGEVCLENSSDKQNQYPAGKLKQFVVKWIEITNDPEIIETVSGVRIEFEQGLVPIQTRPLRNFQFNEREKEVICNEIQDFRDKQVVEETCHEQGEFISNIFLR